MFYQNPDYEGQLDRAEAGKFPLNRSEMQDTIDAATEVETTWWERDRMTEFADKQDERIRAVTGTEFAYPRSSHLFKLGDMTVDTYGMTASPEFGIDPSVVTDHGAIINEYNNDIRRLRQVHPELSDLKTTDEAEFGWLEQAQKLRQESARIQQHSGTGFFDSASLASLWSGVKHGVQEPDNLAMIPVSIMTSAALAPALASSTLFARIGAPVLLDSIYGAGAQYSISSRLEDLRLRLGYSEEEVKAMKWEETATAFGMGAVLGGLFEGGSLGVRKLFRGTGKLGEAIDDLNSANPTVRLKAADEIEAMSPLNDNELDLLREVRRDAMLRASAPVDLKTEASLRAYLDKLKGAEEVAKGGDMPRNWFERLTTYYDADAPRLASAADLVDKADAGARITLDDVRAALAPDQARRFEAELAQTPKAKTERVTLFDVRDLSNEGKTLFKQVEAFAKASKGLGELPENLARDRAFLLVSIDAGQDKDALAWVRDRIINNELDQIKRRVQEVRELTDRTDLLNKWVGELRGEIASAKVRQQVEADRPEVVRATNVLSEQALNRVRFGTARNVIVDSIVQDSPVPVERVAKAKAPEIAKAQFDALQEQPRPNEAALKLDESLAEGKYDKVIEDSRATLIERYGNSEIIDPDTGQSVKVADFIAAQDADIDGLDDILACMMKNAK